MKEKSNAVPVKRHHEAADHDEDDRAIRLEPALPDLHDPPPFPRRRLARLQHFAVRIEGVAFE